MAKHGAGEFNWRMRFEAPVSGDDGGGGVQSGFALRFTVWASLFGAGGSEAVQAARLEGRSLMRVRIRASLNAATITTDWRMVDARTGDVWNIREVDAVSEARDFILLSAERGVAV